jgi:hypothetical protein
VGNIVAHQNAWKNGALKEHVAYKKPLIKSTFYHIRSYEQLYLTYVQMNYIVLPLTPKKTEGSKLNPIKRKIIMTTAERLQQRLAKRQQATVKTKQRALQNAKKTEIEYARLDIQTAQSDILELKIKLDDIPKANKIERLTCQAEIKEFELRLLRAKIQFYTLQDELKAIKTPPPSPNGPKTPTDNDKQQDDNIVPAPESERLEKTEPSIEHDEYDSDRDKPQARYAFEGEPVQCEPISTEDDALTELPIDDITAEYNDEYTLESALIRYIAAEDDYEQETRIDKLDWLLRELLGQKWPNEAEIFEDSILKLQIDANYCIVAALTEKDGKYFTHNMILTHTEGQIRKNESQRYEHKHIENADEQIDEWLKSQTYWSQEPRIFEL